MAKKKITISGKTWWLDTGEYAKMLRFKEKMERDLARKCRIIFNSNQDNYVTK